MAKIKKYLIDKLAVCTDCGEEWDGPRCESEAKKHTDVTGHITTLFITMDIAKFGDKQ